MVHDAPMSLDEAARTLLHGLVKGSTLRAAVAAGTLAHERLGRRIVVTRRDIEEWRERCRVEARKVHGSGCSPSAAPLPVPSSAPSGASSTTAESSGALDAALTIVGRLRAISPPTSARSGSRPASATVQPIR